MVKEILGFPDFFDTDERGVIFEDARILQKK